MRIEKIRCEIKNPNPGRDAGVWVFLQYRPQHCPEISVQLVGAFLHAALNPPEHHFHETARDVVHQKIPGDGGLEARVLIDKLIGDQGVEAVLKIAEEELVALAGQKLQYVIVILLKVLEQMAEHGVGPVGVGVEAVGVARIGGGADNVAEEGFTQGPQQIVLGLEVGVEGGSAHVGGVDDLLHRDFVVAFFSQKASEGCKNSLLGFLLSSVHRLPFRTDGRYCSVMNRPPGLSLAVVLIPDTIKENKVFVIEFIV